MCVAERTEKDAAVRGMGREGAMPGRDEEGRAGGRPPEAGDDVLGGLVGKVNGGGSKGTIIYFYFRGPYHEQWASP
jgi:hypothetical protein